MLPSSSPSTPRRAALAVALSAAAVAALPAAAGAATASIEGDVLVVRAAPGEQNWLRVGPDEDAANRVIVADYARPTAAASVCTDVEWAFNRVSCPRPAGGIRLEAGDGNDIGDVADNLPVGYPITVDGGTGDDVLRGSTWTLTGERLLGGPGNDKLRGGPGDDQLDGGAGDDELEGQNDRDILRGGDGNDTLLADYWQEQSADVIDGGSGFDNIHMNWQSGDDAFQPPIDVSVDGVADDGRPGEGDDVIAVERIYLTAPATLTGSDGDDELTVFNTTDKPSSLSGRGGADQLSGFTGDDTLDGGAGPDTIQGGFGHDAISGGPGRDKIHGDVSGTSCHWIQCQLPYGDDTIDARDGEADAVTCGIGTDKVKADAVDTVSPDCESVDSSGTVPPQPQPQPQPEPKPHPQPHPHPVPGRPGTGAGSGDGTVTLEALQAVRRRSAVVVRGRVTGARRVTIHSRAGRRTLRATATVRGGRFNARLRDPSRRARRVTVTAGDRSQTLRVR